MFDTISENYLSTEELEAGLGEIRRSPPDRGILEMIVCRPAENERKILDTGRLDPDIGLLGDNWKTRGSSRTNDGFGHPEMQLNLMNSRAIALIARTKDRWPLAGDQLFVDLNLSEDDLPAGSRLQIGTAIIEITAIPHNGCKKFAERFGVEAVKFVNSPVGKELHLRGINARVITAGTVSVGDRIEKIPAAGT